jgi:hypothetical protein
MGPIMEHNTQTCHHALALGGLTRLAAPESLLMESTPLSGGQFPTDVILCQSKKLKMNCFDTAAYNLVSRVRMCLMCRRVRPIPVTG